MVKTLKLSKVLGFFVLIDFTEVQLIYNAVLISTLQQSDSVIHI